MLFSVSSWLHVMVSVEIGRSIIKLRTVWHSLLLNHHQSNRKTLANNARKAIAFVLEGPCATIAVDKQR